MNLPSEVTDKRERLLSLLRGYDRVLVAFSGGVDSSLLLWAACQALGDRAVAVTADSPLHPAGERREAAAIAAHLNVRHILISTGEMDLPEFRANPPDRCYICKGGLFRQLRVLAREMGISYILHGANVDDLKDYRPGHAAAAEAGILAPLVEAGLSKAEIRILAREAGLPNWDKPAAPCLATRIPYGTPVTLETVRRIDAAEAFILSTGIRDVRVRLDGDDARIEVHPGEMGILLAEGIRSAVMARLKGLGFKRVTLDLEGYVSGSLNRDLDPS